MNEIDLKKLGNDALRLLRRKKPEILTGIGIGCMLTSTGLAVRATPEAMRRIEARKKEEKHSRLTTMQAIQAAWTCYIPSGITGAAGIACIVGANTISGRRNAALTAAASLAQTSLREYRNKALELIGEEKEGAIRDAVDRERIERNPPKATGELALVEGSAGKTLCYDALFGRYFYSDVEALKRAENKLNRQMATMFEPYISLNEFYAEIGLPSVDIGEELGWNVDNGLIDLYFSSQLVDGRTPCLVVSHIVPPRYDYNK